MDLFGGLLAVFLSLAFGIVPMAVFSVVLTRFDRYEKEPFILLFAVFIWGFLFASLAAIVLNTFFGVGIFYLTGNQNLAAGSTIVFIGPLIEESVKGAGVLLVFLFFRKEFDSILDGLIYGGLIGFGFAAAENVLYIFGGYADSGFPGLAVIALARILLIPFLHATFTALTGIGFATARLSRKGFAVFWPLAGFISAVALHSLHNALTLSSAFGIHLLGFFIDWIGVASLLVFILYLIRNEGMIMRRFLAEEVSLGNLTETQLSSAVSPYRKTVKCWTCLDKKQRGEIGRFYDLSAKLAFRKYQQEKTEIKEKEEIEQLRRDVRKLSRQIPDDA